MIVGADSIAAMDGLRRGPMHRPFEGVRAPSMLGTFTRSGAGRPCPVRVPAPSGWDDPPPHQPDHLGELTAGRPYA